MIRLSSVFWVLLVSAAALATFAVKYEVQTLDDRLADARKATVAEAREQHVLDAEWAYLNRPEMLAAMNERFLKLAPITREQLQTRIADIPLRPLPPPPAAPAAIGQVAALDTGSAGPASDAASPDTPAVRAATPDPPALNAAAPNPAPAAPPRPLLVRTAAVSPARAPALDNRVLDNRALDQLIARISARR